MIGYYVDVAVGFIGNTWQLATVFIKDSDIDGENDNENAQIEKLAEAKVIEAYVQGNMFPQEISFTKVLWISDPEEFEDPAVDFIFEEDIS